MAKSARSKSRIKNRNALRATVFGPHEAERIKRLAEKQRITSGNTEDLMMDTEEATTTAKEVEMTETGSGTKSELKPTSKLIRKQSKNGKRVVVRNKKGRVMSKNSVSWVKQKRFK
ncbi:hypothetical protein IW140_003112 [Coemansia sp. RSA 1813]|nr:hypothetical protein EV178_003020 [Coemansia sp. RSA 1646]KAJ1769234.1 hypothetical protein LPJ74_004233 [Coemansia sp. RSA 1843]KAJ2089503.1 hypothetical protein IW138_003392 [Coemansia sp. RSA 986]KAJ2214526.1 hypothetical protein EV179_002931 [Coemansia sp. RSA 487]KAJ2569409.1 hypothetical protein IW140_003112 [Coemansia sp. RSA 1813]